MKKVKKKVKQKVKEVEEEEFDDEFDEEEEEEEVEETDEEDIKSEVSKELPPLPTRESKPKQTQPPKMIAKANRFEIENMIQGHILRANDLLDLLRSTQ